MHRTQRVIWTMVAGLLAGGAGGVAGCANDMAGEVVEEAPGQARASLETLWGCFSVRYHFVEDGENDFFFADNTEYMDVSRQGDGYYVRNYLITGEQSSFLHWTQTWTPESEDVWTMRVEDGAGELRYETRGVWRFNQWDSEPALAAKPNRDGDRTDYDLLQRNNVIQFTPGRWVHTENNIKVRQDGTPVASEVGWITYTRMENDDACAPAMTLASRPAAAPSPLLAWGPQAGEQSPQPR